MPKLTVLGVILMFISLVALALPKRMNKAETNSICLIGIVIGILMIVASGLRMVDAGNVGVQVFLGNVKDKVLTSGIHIVNPITKVVPLSVRTQSYTMSGVTEEGNVKGDDAIATLTKDGVSIRLDVTAWYHLNETQAAVLYKTIGADYNDKIVRPAIRTAVRDAVVEYKAEDIYSEKRIELVKNMEKQLGLDLSSRGIEIEKILLRNVVLPPLISRAIDEKLSALQDAQKMEFVLQKAELEAKRKEVEAKGIAASQKIIADSLTTEYLSWYYVQTLKEIGNSSNNTFVITPFDQKIIPMMNVSQDKKPE